MELEQVQDECCSKAEQVRSLEQYEALVLGACGELETIEEYRTAMKSLVMDAERYRWLRDQPIYPTWKGVAAAGDRDTAIDILMTETPNG